MCGEGMGCVGVAGTVPVRQAARGRARPPAGRSPVGTAGVLGGALRRAAGGVGRRARRERALDKATVGVGGGEGGGVW
jgi:hypothetical protein